MRKIAALAVLALVGGCSLSSEFADKDEPELDPTIAAVDVARDDPNREAYYLRDMHNWMDEFGIQTQEYDPDEDLLDAALAAELDRITTDYTRLGLARSHIRARLVAALEGDPK